MKRLLTLGLLALLFLISACTKTNSLPAVSSEASAPDSYGISLDSARRDYLLNYLGSSLDSTTWTGNTDQCDAGNSSAETKTTILQRLNYFRRLVGLPGNLVCIDSLNRKCQQAALMMESNWKLSHQPTADWHCYTEDGAEAAAFSNLALGVSGPAAMDAYINDGGVTTLSHRRWVLFPPLTAVGTGDTRQANALWVIGNFGTRPDIQYVAYPGNGYIPAPLVFQYWSFSLPAADFSQATVQLTDTAGNPLALQSWIPEKGYGDNTIAWQLNNFDPQSLTADTKINVSIDNVLVQGQVKSYQYTVDIFIP